MTKLTLHFAPRSCALVTLVALEAAGHPFDIELVQLMKAEQREPAFLALNPAGRVPVLVVDGMPIIETAAILTWLSGRFPEKHLLPDPGDFEGRIKVLSDLTFCSATLQSFVPRIRLPQFVCATDPERVRVQAIEMMRLQLDWIEARLANGWWYGERWSLVDAHLNWIWVAVSRPPGIDAALYPNLSRHAADSLALPAVQRARAREQAALAESGATGSPP